MDAKTIPVSPALRARYIEIAKALDVSFQGVVALALRPGYSIPVPPVGTRGPIAKAYQGRPRLGFRIPADVWASMLASGSAAQLVRDAIQALYLAGAPDDACPPPETAVVVWRRLHEDAKKTP